MRLDVVDCLATGNELENFGIGEEVESVEMFSFFFYKIVQSFLNLLETFVVDFQLGQILFSYMFFLPVPSHGVLFYSAHDLFPGSLALLKRIAFLL